jgi:hypothetical protein
MLTLLSSMEQSASSVRTSKLSLIWKPLNAKSVLLIPSSTLRNTSVNKFHTTLIIKLWRTICLMELPYQMLQMEILRALLHSLFSMVLVSNAYYPAIGMLKKTNAKIVQQVRYSILTQKYVQFL